MSAKQEGAKEASARPVFQSRLRHGVSRSGSVPEVRSEPKAIPFAVLDLLQTPACLISDSGGIVHLNDEWRAFGGDDGEGTSPWAQLIWPEDRPAALTQFRGATIAGQNVDFECRLQGNGPAPRWFLLGLHSVAEGLPGGNGWLCIATDIHDLTQQSVI